MLIWASYATAASGSADLNKGDKTAKTTGQTTSKSQIVPCSPPLIISQNWLGQNMRCHPCLDAQQREEIMNWSRNPGPSAPSPCLHWRTLRGVWNPQHVGIAASSCCVTARPLLRQTCHWPRQLRAEPTDHRGPASRWLISKSNYRCWLKSLQPRAAWGRTLLGYCLGEMVAKQDGLRMDDWVFPDRLPVHHKVLGKAGLSSGLGSADMWLVVNNTLGNMKWLLQKQKQNQNPPTILFRFHRKWCSRN